MLGYLTLLHYLTFLDRTLKRSLKGVWSWACRMRFSGSLTSELLLKSSEWKACCKGWPVVMQLPGESSAQLNIGRDGRSFPLDICSAWSWGEAYHDLQSIHTSSTSGLLCAHFCGLVCTCLWHASVYIPLSQLLIFDPSYILSYCPCLQLWFCLIKQVIWLDSLSKRRAEDRTAAPEQHHWVVQPELVSASPTGCSCIQDNHWRPPEWCQDIGF